MKRSIYQISVLLVLLFALSVSLKAEVKLPAIFGDNMVLQQQTDAAIWGTAGVDAGGQFPPLSVLFFGCNRSPQARSS